MTFQPRNRDLADYQHHVNNLMVIVRSIASRTAEKSRSVDEFSAHFDGRLAALGRAQKILARSADFEIDLEELVHEELLSQAAGNVVEVTVKGPAVLLSQKAAENLALALHELATNAVKFGGLDGVGRLAVTWQLGQQALVLEWRETQVSAVDPQPARYGFGRELIEQGLPYQLGAQTDMAFKPGGLVCTIVVPVCGHARAGDGT